MVIYKLVEVKKKNSSSCLASEYCMLIYRVSCKGMSSKWGRRGALDPG